MKILVAGPFLGELGWEVFSFQPIVRGEYLKGQYDKLIVYADQGRTLLYQDADEIRDFTWPEGLDSACNSSMYLPEQVQIHKQLIDKIDNELANEFPDAEIGRIHGLSLPRCDPMLDIVAPDLLVSGKGFELPRIFDDKKTICLCIRDREFSDFRNWGYGNWGKLITDLKDVYNILTVGLIRNPIDWVNQAIVPYASEDTKGFCDKTNDTTIDDCIEIFHRCDLVVGGSSGTMHLASRCGRPHLVWGFKENTKRYVETNYNKVDHKVYELGWQPHPTQIAKYVRHYLDNGKFE